MKLNRKKEIVAIKVLDHVSKKDRLDNLSELGHLNILRNENIIRFYYAYEWDDKLWIITEYLEEGTLKDFSRTQPLKENIIAYISKQVLNGISYIHSMGIIHRDIKTSNIMLTRTESIKISILMLGSYY